MAWLLILIATFVLIFLLRERIFSHVRIILWSRNISGPFAFPILGNGYKFLCHKDEIFSRIRKMMRDYPQPLFRIWMGPKLALIIREPHHIQKILQSSMIEKDPIMDVAKPYIGEGLITNSGPTWKSHRKLILPALGAKSIEEYCEVFHRESAIMVDKMIKSKNNVITLDDFLHPCSIDIVCDTIIDHRLNAQTSLNHDFMEAYLMMYVVMYERIVKPWLFPDFLFQFSSLAGVHKKTLKTLRSFVLDVIQKRRDLRQARLVEQVINSKCNYGDMIENYDEEEENDENDRGPPSNVKMNTILDKLLEASENGSMELNDDELIDEILTMFVASSDTISSITSFCLKMLAMHPEYQKKVVEEFKEVTSIHGDDLTSSALAELVFLERCIKETIRLFPIAPFIVRINRTEFKLDETTTIPKNVSVMMGLFFVHRDPRYWSNPEEFYPDHFLPEAVEKRHPYAYVPFSSGLRACIGKLYAMIAIKIMVIKVLQKLKMNPAPDETSVKDMKLTSDISVRVMGGNRIMATPIHK